MIVSLWLSGGAFAQNKPGSEPEKKAHEEFQTLLKQADKNKDGKLSKDEYLATCKDDKKTCEDKFKAIDENGDGYITEEEYVKSMGPMKM